MIRCKSILCPPSASFHPTNITKPPPAESALSIPLSSSPLFPLYPHSFLSSLSFFLNVDHQSHSVCFLLLLPLSQILLKFVQIGEDTSGSSLEGQQETRDCVMDVLCRGKTAIFCLQLCLASLHPTHLLTVRSLSFHNGVQVGVQVSADPLPKPNSAFGVARREGGERHLGAG